MAVTENRVAELQERLKEVMKCEQLNKQQFMNVTDISNIGRKLDGKVAITKMDISKMKHSLLVNDQWLETGIGPKDPKDMRKSSPHPIDSKISTYYNRHSWATFASEIGISLETIGRALGHSVWEKTVTAIYVKYDNKAVDEANRKVIDYLNKQ